MVQYHEARLRLESVDLSDLANLVKTPCYVYSGQTLKIKYQTLNRALRIPHLICFSVKANGNLTLLRKLREWGSGFDIVSEGELKKVLAIEADPQKIVFSGVGKTAEEIHLAIQAGILSINVESLSELKRIESLAKVQNKKVNLFLRINPDIHVKTHPYITTGLQENKFGLPIKDIDSAVDYIQRSSFLNLNGIASHIGSQLLSLEPFLIALKKNLAIIQALRTKGIPISFLDLGGGLGIAYQTETAPSLEVYAAAISSQLENTGIQLILEPGRALVGESGLLLTRVEYIKKISSQLVAIMDAGMTELIRPALYQAEHNIIPVLKRKGKPRYYDIVGPVCESSDFLGKRRALILKEGDILAVTHTGGYGSVMSSNYNARYRVPEIWVEGDKYLLIRRRENFQDLIRTELDLPDQPL